MAPSVLSDVSVRASGRVAENRVLRQTWNYTLTITYSFMLFYHNHIILITCNDYNDSIFSSIM